MQEHMKQPSDHGKKKEPQIFEFILKSLDLMELYK
jgi:hypothetical protein